MTSIHSESVISLSQNAGWFSNRTFLNSSNQAYFVHMARLRIPNYNIAAQLSADLLSSFPAPAKHRKRIFYNINAFKSLWSPICHFVTRDGQWRCWDYTLNRHDGTVLVCAHLLDTKTIMFFNTSKTVLSYWQCSLVLISLPLASCRAVGRLPGSFSGISRSPPVPLSDS